MPKEGDWVVFRISDVYLPGVAETLLALDERALLLGRVVGFSDSGLRPGAFGVVELDGGQKVIVSTENLRGISEAVPDRRDAENEKESEP